MEKEREFERLFRLYYERLFFFARQMVGSEDDSHDVVHGVFEDLWQHISDIHEDSVKSWLYTLTRNRCINHLRRQGARQQYIDFCRRMTECYGTDGYDERDERDQLVKSVLAKFDPVTRDVFNECFLKEQRYQDVAEKTGRSLSSIKKIMAAALRLMNEGKYKKNIKNELS